MEKKIDADIALYLLTLAGLILAGSLIRLSNLDSGSAWHDYDEGVHLSASLLLTKGYTPYVDFFFAHPPLSLHMLGLVVGEGGGQAYTHARMISATLSSLTLVALAAAAYLSLGKAAALAGTAFLAFDGFAAYNSRMVMLEPYVDFFLSVSLLCYVLLVRCRSTSQEFFTSALSGLALGLALSSKISSLFGIAAMLLHSIIFRRIRVTLIIAAAAVSTYLLVSARYLLADADLYLRQTVLFHVVRPPDGVPHSERLRWVLTSFLDLGVVWAGAPALIIAILLTPRLVRSKTVPREAYIWIMWSLAYLLAFSTTKTFFGHYIQHLITPLSYVAAMPLEYALKLKTPPWKASAAYLFPTKILPVWLVSMLILQTGIISVVYPPSARDDTPMEVSRRLTELGATGSSIIAFEPIYTFLSGTYPSNTVIDSYGYMMFEGMNLGRNKLFEALLKYLSGDLYDSWPIYNEKVQEKITGDILTSRFIIIDWRARWQLTDENLYKIYQHSNCLTRVRDIEICMISQ
ncbi:MAG: phospholipid carrier-dependent glycosyltransferase [Nitrososphaerota archaeon]|nr:phospholipid carrier-dependent glycosyltransferase [Candidatus Calditenuaceae archaeon]MDW8073196.1 phospholipid carrier-dependent glycosyltransferase [Nitrososphaerota archaeon]